MRPLKFMLIVSFVFAFTLTMTGFVIAAEEKCPFCGMKMEGNENTAYEITTPDGKTTTYCCPHCGLWVHATEKDKVKSARARCFIMGEWMDASKMVYLFNSSAVPACSPSWIAFGKKGGAEKFQKGFGGTIYTFDEAIKERPKHPKAMEMEKGMEMKH
ncbi:MAG: nitrous oxide reductase accessory protein NosL [Nitrospirae bacterium]|nr:nitrous oxide reductase accessory protein NosL [Nitrospirota bacterium]